MRWRFQNRRKSSLAQRPHHVWPLLGNILYWCCRPEAVIEKHSPKQTLPQ